MNEMLEGPPDATIHANSFVQYIYASERERVAPAGAIGYIRSAL